MNKTLAPRSTAPAGRRLAAPGVELDSETIVDALEFLKRQFLEPLPESFGFRVVFPRAANAAAGNISVLAPLGMAVLGRRVGEEITWSVPAGARRLRVEDVLYQPERDGRDLAEPPTSLSLKRVS